MSLSIGIYDFFAFTVPGFLYLFVANEAGKLFGFNYFDLKSLNNISYLIVLTGFSFLVGHLFDTIGHAFWEFTKKILNFVRKNKILDSVTESLNDVKNGHPELKIDFFPFQWAMLHHVIISKNTRLSDRIDQFKATSIMMRSFSFGLVLLSIVDVGFFVKSGSDYHFLASGVIFLFFALVANNRSRMYNQWFYGTIFEEAIKYGTTLASVLQSTSTSVREENDKSKKQSRRPVK